MSKASELWINQGMQFIAAAGSAALLGNSWQQIAGIFLAIWAIMPVAR